MTDYDNSNSGLLFPPRNEKLVKTGRVAIDGIEHRMIILSNSIPDKVNGGEKTIYEAYIKAGDIFQTQKRSDKDSDMDGKFQFPRQDKKVWYRSVIAKESGQKLTSVSLAPLKSNSAPAGQTEASPGSAGAGTATSMLNDTIPF